MNILAITYGANPTSGGIERFCFTIFNQLIKKGIDLSIYSYNPLENEFPSITLPVWKIFDDYFLYYHIRFSLDKKVDYILCCHLFLIPLADRLANATGSKIILCLYGIECWGERIKQYSKYFSHIFYACSISSFTTEQVISQGFPSDKILYFPPAVTDSQKFSPTYFNKEGKKSDFTLLTIGRLASNEKYKGHDMVIKSLAFTIKQGLNVRYQIVGAGDDITRLKSLSKRHGVEDRVNFLGYIPDNNLPEIYAKSDAFIMPSRVSLDPGNLQGEGFGIVFVEAALMQLPLIGPNEGGSMDIIINGVTGLTVEPRSPESIADAIIRLSRDQELSRRLGRTAREYCIERFSLENIDKYLDPLINLL